MFRRVMLFRNLTDNIPKNIGLYSVGVMLLLLFHVEFDLLQVLLGLLAFLVSYSSIYVLNDLYDVEEDMTDEKKALRKPLATGMIKENDAVKIFASFLIVGLVLSISVTLSFFFVVVLLVLTNMIYSRSLKHTILGLPSVLLMQMLKIFLAWTTSTEILQFPLLFAVGISLIYVILFKGYKLDRTIGESVKHEPVLIISAIITFILSMSWYSEFIHQASILVYLIVGIVLFRNSHLTDRKVLLLSPIFILFGVFMLIFVILYL